MGDLTCGAVFLALDASKNSLNCHFFICIAHDSVEVCGCSPSLYVLLQLKASLASPDVNSYADLRDGHVLYKLLQLM